MELVSWRLSVESTKYITEISILKAQAGNKSEIWNNKVKTLNNAVDEYLNRCENVIMTLGGVAVSNAKSAISQIDKISIAVSRARKTLI